MKRKLCFVLATLFVPGSVFAQSAEQATSFDLICDGQAFYSDMKPRSVTHHYRINLTEMRWCWEKCERTRAIVSATVDRITFHDTTNDGYRSYVSRIDGSYSRFNPGRSGTRISDTGTCKAAPFSGMPKPIF